MSAPGEDAALVATAGLGVPPTRSRLWVETSATLAFLLSREQYSTVELLVLAWARRAEIQPLLDRARAAVERGRQGRAVLRPGTEVRRLPGVLLDGHYAVDDAVFRIVSRPKGYLASVPPSAQRTRTKTRLGTPVRVLQLRTDRANASDAGWRGFATVDTPPLATLGGPPIRMWRRFAGRADLAAAIARLTVNPEHAFDAYPQRVGRCPACDTPLPEGLTSQTWVCLPCAKRTY